MVAFIYKLHMKILPGESSAISDIFGAATPLPAAASAFRANGGVAATLMQLTAAARARN